MATVGVGVFISEDLYWYGDDEHSDGWRARDRAATFIEGAINEFNHIPDVYKSDDRPDPHRESMNESWSQSCPCFTEYQCDFNGVLNYFRRWIENCNIDVKSDANILITNTSKLNGGLAYTHTNANKAFAQTGQAICDLPATYETWGNDDAHNAMHTVYEEIGHNLMKGANDANEDQDDDGIYQHDAGAIFQHDGSYTITGMGINGGDTQFNQDKIENDCGYTYDTGENIH